MPSLNLRSPAGRVKLSQHKEWVYILVPTLHLGNTRKFLGTPAFASSPLWSAVGRNIARRSQNGESNQMRFAICDWTPRGCQESDSDSEGLWEARNLAFLLQVSFSLPAQPPAESCLNLRSR